MATINCLHVCMKEHIFACEACPSCEPCLPCVVALVIEPFPLVYLNPQSKNCQILWIMLAIARNFSVPYLSDPSPGSTTSGAVNISSDRQEVFQSFFYCNFFALYTPMKNSFLLNLLSSSTTVYSWILSSESKLYPTYYRIWVLDKRQNRVFLFSINCFQFLISRSELILSGQLKASLQQEHQDLLLLWLWYLLLLSIPGDSTWLEQPLHDLFHSGTSGLKS